VTDVSGHIAISYHTPATHLANGEDVITAQNTASLPTIKVTDHYVFDGVARYTMHPRPIAATHTLAGNASVVVTLTALNSSGAAVPSAVVEDPAVAHRGIRTELHRYFGLPFYRAMFAQAGYEADIAAYDAAPDVTAQRDAISDAFIEDLCAIGKPADVAAGVARYRAAGATNPMVTNIAGTDLRPTLHAAVAA